MKNNLCVVIKIPVREKIFRNLEFDKNTNKIYTACGTGPIGENINGKIKWYKKYA